MKFDTLAILGVGLLGGSVALAARQRSIARSIVGVEPDETRWRLASMGLVDEVVSLESERVAQADVVVCCVPVDRIVELVLRATSRGKPGQVVTDVGSTKAIIVREIEARQPHHVHFVGSHPLAGSEKSGPDHSSAGLFENRLVVLTPTNQTHGEAVSFVGDFWQSLGARVRLMSPEDHDRAVAVTSHLPHLLSSALVRMLPEELSELTATGFRDMTRLAEGDPALWMAIFAQNRDFLLQALDLYEEQLHDFRRALSQGDTTALTRLLDSGRQRRRLPG
jgi:prephenate dehydrogenase